MAQKAPDRHQMPRGTQGPQHATTEQNVNVEKEENKERKGEEHNIAKLQNQDGKLKRYKENRKKKTTLPSYRVIMKEMRKRRR